VTRALIEQPPENDGEVREAEQPGERRGYIGARRVTRADDGLHKNRCTRCRENAVAGAKRPFARIADKHRHQRRERASARLTGVFES